MTRQISLIAVLAMSGLVLTGPALAQTNWDMATPYADSDFHTRNIAQFADEVSTATGGGLTITVHSAGSLFGHPEIKDSVRKGLAPIGEVLMSRLANEDPVFEVDSVPFLANGYDQALKLWQASRETITQKLADQGLTLLYVVPWPGQGIYTKDAVTDAASFQGQNMRAYNAASERLAQLLGAVPTQVEAGDVPTAFSTGRVSAMITSPSTGVTSQAWDFTSFYTDAQAWLPKNMVIVNTEAFNALPEDQRAAITQAAAQAETRGWDMSAVEATEATEALAKNGMTVAKPSEAFQAELLAIGETMTNEWLERAGEPGKAIIDAYRAE
ncbi:TRAP transporter substrate-binding protein [uncultured Paracoccus sp.]|uniref:TRAP transporter substrate-binding protein n=1 Tax=uncultured Paracoccus sp. TaxID=189685 RepID=UPI002620FCE0|nr:TRAP transporter substrate-binding protein [uncultured Paracoccus sp.]